ncbi:signal peptidase I [Phenylobacterium sp. J367]|uniref:signal peptidase I n=1 Tax=Phenylobacterium sp. J367 TaxID=2898435 RepID=UPI002151A287|nr:signal peptidase I [Phenylobacterium sp. J367]MCR5880616.1 signal peptidase I [Phenylobacterium sp. J367]
MSKKETANEAWEVAKTIFWALVIALVLRVFLLQPYTIPSASMEPNLYEGDYIVVTKWSYGYSRHSAPLSPPLFEGRILGQAPERGDVIVFKTPLDNRTDLIKRLVGLPGDRIQIRDSELWLNGVKVPRAAVPRTGKEDPRSDGADLFRETLPGGRSYVIQDYGPGQPLDDTEVFVVPEGHYFMMGDNRDNSADSRVPAAAGGVGFLPDENLVGRARVVLISWKPGASILKPWTWLNLNLDRVVKPLG